MQGGVQGYRAWLGGAHDMLQWGAEGMQGICSGVPGLMQEGFRGILMGIMMPSGMQGGDRGDAWWDAGKYIWECKRLLRRCRAGAAWRHAGNTDRGLGCSGDGAGSVLEAHRGCRGAQRA